MYFILYNIYFKFRSYYTTTATSSIHNTHYLNTIILSYIRTPSPRRRHRSLYNVMHVWVLNYIGLFIIIIFTPYILTSILSLNYNTADNNIAVRILPLIINLLIYNQWYYVVASIPTFIVEYVGISQVVVVYSFFFY